MTTLKFQKQKIHIDDQRKLDQYKRQSLSKEEIGAFYERYIGYLLEIEAYRVEYVGIRFNFEDMGRDLIASRGNETLIVQCKMWSRDYQIHEKHIYQLYGTASHFQMNCRKKVKPIFVSTTKISEKAQEAASQLGVECRQIQLDKSYPMIKCNINRKGRHYHLPDEEIYDKIQIVAKQGEHFVHTVEEALKLGFESANVNFKAA